MLGKRDLSPFDPTNFNNVSLITIIIIIIIIITSSSLRIKQIVPDIINYDEKYNCDNNAFYN